ncbi:unnamed protein product [Auanema sp. JU1783]|nr:unnamed protein product [Auanema sp. JU1783]
MQFGQVPHGAASSHSTAFSDGMSSGSRSPPSYQHDSSSSYEDSSSSSSMNCRHSCKGSVKSFSSFDYNRRTIGESFKPGMKDVPAWLKALRLHKYTEMFQTMSYDEMLNLDDVELERRQVTQGARKKILQSIQKLKNRSIAIREQYRSLSQNIGCVRCAILTLRQLLLTPIRLYVPKSGEPKEYVEGNTNIVNISDDNIPALLIRLLVSVSPLVFPTQNGEEIEDNYLSIMFSIYDKVANNEAFLDCQRRRAIQLKKQARRFTSPQDLRRNNNSFTHSSVRCDNCQHRNVPNNANCDFLHKSNGFHVPNNDRRDRTEAFVCRPPQRMYNNHTLQNAQKQPWMNNNPRQNANLRQNAETTPLFSDMIWGTCAQEARLSEFNDSYNTLLSMNGPAVHVAKLPQYRSSRSNQQMMAPIKQNTNVIGNRVANEANNFSRPHFFDEYQTTWHGQLKFRDEPSWPASIYSTQIGKLPSEDCHKSFAWGLARLDNSDMSDYLSSASTSERSSDAGSPRSRASNNRTEDDSLHRLLESIGSMRTSY